MEKATLVLDMRGTLMSQVNARQSPNLVEYALSPAKEGSSLLVLKRPFVDQFLERMAALFEVVVFTSCGEKAASDILDLLDPAGKYFSRRFYANSCKHKGVKDLSVLGRPTERVLIIDDSFKKCVLNPDNWIPISTFRRNLGDRELMELVPFLERISGMEDVRPAIREAFGSKVAEERAKLQEPDSDDPEPKAKIKMKGHQIEGSGRINALGKLLCKILRHRAVELGLHIRSDGYCKVDDLLKLDIKTRSKIPLSSHSLADVLKAVEQNTKQRLSTMVDEDNLVYIRASQGHSLQEVSSQELLKEITSADEVAICVHGTSETAVDSIMREGLKVMKRKHVHFATGLPEDGGVISGMRSSCEVLIYLDVNKAMEDGMKLYMSDNGVVLTEGFQGTIPCSYFEKIVRLSKCSIRNATVETD